MKLIKTIKSFIEKDSTKEAVKKVKIETLEGIKTLKYEFNRFCENVDVKLKASLNKSEAEAEVVVETKGDVVSEDSSKEIPKGDVVSEDSSKEIPKGDVAPEIKKETEKNIKVELTTDNDSEKSLIELGFSKKIADLLSTSDQKILTLGDLRKANLETLLIIKGIGKTTIDKINKII